MTAFEGPPSCRGRVGVALPLLLFLLLALTLLAHGTLLLALQEHRASTAFRDATRARMAARSALVQPLDSLPFPPFSAGVDAPAPVVQEDLGDGLERLLEIRWLSREVFLMEAQGRSRGWPGVGRVAGVGWRMDPLTRMRDFSAAMEVGGDVVVSGPAQISSNGFLDLPLDWDPSDCEPYRTDLELLFPSGSTPPTAPLQPPPSPPDGDGWLPGLGLLTGDRLLSLVARGGGEGTMGPTEMQGSGCPDSGTPRVWIRSGSQTLSGERWCGLLVVEGDLRLEYEGRFQGLLLVGGTLTVGSGWMVEGMGRIGGDLRMSEGGRVEASGCPALRVLEEVTALRAPFLLPGASELAVW